MRTPRQRDEAAVPPSAVRKRTVPPTASRPFADGVSPATLTALQRTAGNAAVVRALVEGLGQDASARERHSHDAHCGHGRPVQRSAVHEALRSSGRPLDAPVRAEMEARFGGADFSGVRLHTDAVARRSAKEVGALAYTSGNDIVLGAGTTDRHTLAHELTHVVQQRRGPVSGTPTADGLSVSDPGDRFEREAEANARRVMAGPVPEPAPVQRSAEAPAARAADGPVAVQRAIKVTPEMYMAGVNVTPETVSAPQLRMYFEMVLRDEANHAQAMCTDVNAADLVTTCYETLLATLQQKAPNTQTALAQTKGLIDAITAAQTMVATMPQNKNSRYATTPDPASGYQHTPRKATADREWGTDDNMRGSFAKGLGPKEATLGEAKPRKTGNLPLKQLPWPEAYRLLPRPLLNLLFDVRYQLEAPPGDRQVIDERTDLEKANRDATPNDPGTLRSWHQDDSGRLPANGFDSENVPAHATALHEHYTDNSKSGSGSSVQVAADGPRGFAEYTGTGTDATHNVKVVLDYVQKRVYLTLTHYQYWALIPPAAGGSAHTFWESRTQDLEAAEGGLAQVPGGDRAVMMSPWAEILMPRRSQA
ncbi:DUF4157 domain-containing protein [Streptomyces sp. NPDC096132]|uniref:eCIS core domain-containing protein n=1 Tax=Streptomyces sp. NPDC096132 TaxID=3366075 RepID=UPI00382BEF33